MDWKLELIVVPVSDVERAKRFYHEQIGFAIDVDHQATETVRLVQLTPPGSACSIMIGTGLIDSAPGSLKGLHLIVHDVDRAREHLLAAGVAVGPIRHIEDGAWTDGRGGPWNSFVFFSDPDGNEWAVQERPAT